MLLKPGPLSADEYARMKEHTVIGDQLCGAMRSLRAVRPIIRHHHERIDGSGYPDALRREAARGWRRRDLVDTFLDHVARPGAAQEAV